MLTDYHTHSYRCGHAVGSMREYVETAIRAGIDEIGLTDHLWLYFQEPGERNATWAIAEDEYVRHYEEMLTLRTEYAGRIVIRVSAEADYVEGKEEELLSILRRFEFDYVLGSVHFMDGWLIDDPKNEDRYRQEPVTGIYRRYYAQLRKAIALGCFDLLAHFDLPKKFGFRPEEDVSAEIALTLDAAAEYGLAIEVSSAGLRKPVGEMYPSRSILQEMRRRDIPISLSSDAHSPEEVGHSYAELISEARSAGYDELATFEGRVRRMRKLG